MGVLLYTPLDMMLTMVDHELSVIFENEIWKIVAMRLKKRCCTLPSLPTLYYTMMKFF